MPEIIRDLADVGRRQRVQYEWPNGQAYDMLGPQDFDPVLGAELEAVAEWGAEDTGDKLENARRQRDMVRKQAQIICPDVPADVVNATPWQFLAGIVGAFTAGVQESGGMAPEVKAIFDRLQTPQTATST